MTKETQDLFTRLNNAARDPALKRNDFRILFLALQEGAWNVSRLSRIANIPNRTTVSESIRRLMAKGYLLE